MSDDPGGKRPIRKRPEIGELLGPGWQDGPLGDLVRGKWDAPKLDPQKFPQRDTPFQPRFPFPKPDVPILPGRGGNFGELSASFSQIPDDVPLVLLPVRLETRFKGQGSARELQIRIMPGDIFLSPRTEQVAKDTLSAAEEFAELVDENGPDHPEVLAAWSGFMARPDALAFAHAYQVARGVLKAETAERADLDTGLVSPLLPDRWFAVGYTDGALAFSAFSQTVVEEIDFLPDPGDLDAASDPATNARTHWMFDFETAWNKGMAIKAPLEGAARERIDSLYVLGWRDNRTTGNKPRPGSRKTAEAFADTLRSQHYAFGAGFVPQGLATNNTDAVRSGWSPGERSPEAAWQREAEQKGTGVVPVAHAANQDAAPLWPGPGLMSGDEEDHNAGRMAAAFGLADIETLRRFQFREGSEAAAMEAMNTALWPATLGELLGTILDQPGEDDFFDSELVSWVRTWFRNRVHGGGRLPAIRIGERPYGVLPIQRQTARQFGMSLLDAGKQPERQLEIFLETLFTHWLAGSRDVVRLAGEDMPGNGFGTPGEQLMAVLHSGPHPQSFYTSSVESGERNITWTLQENRQSLTDVDGSELLRDAYTLDFGEDGVFYIAPDLPDLFDWPANFSSAGAMERHLASLQAVHASILNGPRLYPFDDSWGEAFADVLRDQNGEALERIVALFDEVLLAVRDHEDRNHVLRLLGAPTTLANSVLGGAVDPPFSYLMHGIEEVPWPADRLVRVDKGAETVEPSDWLTNLEAYAEATAKGEAVPDEPAFPDGEKPLLYHLIRTGLRRVATRKSRTAGFLSSLLDEVAVLQGSVPFHTVESLSGPELVDLNETLVVSFSPTRSATATVESDGVLRLMRGATASEVAQLAGNLSAVAGQSGQQPDAPLVQMLELSETLEAVVRNWDATVLKGTLKPLASSRITEINQIKAALGRLRQMAPEQLRLLMSQTLGVVSWRLDAWISSLSDNRLEQMRAKVPEGMQIGAYGYVENLNRALGALDGQSKGRSQGFIPAPSIAHAKTAAVLRAGWTAYGSDAADSPFAVNLSSRRVRRAREAMDALRQGQDLADILGQQVESDLRDSAAGAIWVLPLRLALPEGQTQRGARAQHSVDGLELHRLIVTGTGEADLIEQAKEVLIDLLPASQPYDTAWEEPLKTALSNLRETVDALSDTGIAEAVHQLVLGNVARAGGTLRALQTGDAPPPELDVLQTGPAAVGFQHQVILPLPVTADTAEEARSLSMLADPHLDAALDRVLKPLHALELKWQAISPADGQEEASGVLSWRKDVADTLGLGTSDLLRATAQGGIGGLAGWVGAALAHAGTVRLSATSEIRLQAANLPRGVDEGIAEAMLDAWRAVLGQARAFDARDIPPGAAAAEMVLGDVEGRATTVKGCVADAVAVLDAAVGGSDVAPDDLPDDFDPLPSEAENALLDLARADFREALTVHRLSRSGEGQGLGRALKGVLRRARALAAEIGTYTPDASASPEARLKAARDTIRRVLGRSHPVVVPVRWEGLQEYADSFAKSAARLAGLDGTPSTWIERQGYTHEPLGQLGLALDVAEVAGEGGFGLHVAQWPEPSGAVQWIAETGVTDREGPTRSVVVIQLQPDSAANDEEKRPPVAVDPDAGFAALVLADVVEAMPAMETDMAAAMHFDSPNAEAPQAILLALPRDEDEGWSFDTVLQTVQTAFDLARIRAVDGGYMSQFNQILPAIFAGAGLHAENDHGD
ncbi:hypothetical protein [Tropicimonas marinistellae]|uniref:hypothetical protein n=1 Tax=Tropicimonas marinistellae TaxID=1739787 RepID=UPI000831D6C9|nr:hypothetical protein [Tropicimonas marinistellae]